MTNLKKLASFFKMRYPWRSSFNLDLKVGGSRPSPCHHVVSLHKKLYPRLSLSTQVYKMGTGDILLAVTLNGLASHPGGSSNTLSCFMHRNQVKFCLYGPPWLVCDFTLQCVLEQGKKIFFNNNFFLIIINFFLGIWYQKGWPNLDHFLGPGSRIW